MTYADLNGDGEVTPGEIIEENNYYPFGLRHKGYNELATENPAGFKYKFGGKELNDELGFEVYDFGARNYDPALGRWMNIDPLAEEMRRFSPYNYAFNNPVFFIDPDGMMPMGFDKDKLDELELIVDINETLAYDPTIMGMVDDHIEPDHIVIGYKNKKGETKGFVFNGENYDEAPNNDFVQSFLNAYKFNIENGGGHNVKLAANDEFNLYYVFETSGGNRSKLEEITGRNITLWNPKRGLLLDNGDVLSPATILEHEFAHSYKRQIFPQIYKQDVDFKMKEYSNREEYRVIHGAEKIQAKLNGELSPDRHYTRSTHRSGDRTQIFPVEVETPTSTNVIKLNR